ncbi:sodium/potassium-transporting ATPase subunit beta-1-interacting protein 1-like isoform X4 [Mytilus galloprovincialis]|uniref:sodium/potassium-transporting ATPase subunit beta-1-interacting protein 1-like isoform X4 n=1 Tax=Mytilus galloprovincialis TaxID=29158 RepID=UPI003F7BB37A
MKYKQLSIVAMAFQGKCANTAMYTAMMVVILLQFLSTLERQVFDFLGYMWAPIIANFFQLICVIIGGFGTYQFRSKFITLYSTWSLIWLGWNVFVICLYLEVGVLSRNKDLYILNIGTKNKSWWLEHGIGCRITNTSWLDSSPTDSSRPIPPEDVVEGCLLDYYYVEVIHAGVQVLLALIGFVISCVNAYIFVEEEESSSNANDELEFVKMYQTPSRPGYEIENQTFQTEQETNEYPTLDRPPSYETSMRNQANRNAVSNDYTYGADRQSVRSVRSVRSTRSTRSKASNKSKNTNRQSSSTERREELPWVQITPSPSSYESPFRHYP